MVDMDRSGFIDESELPRALSSGYQRCSRRTIRLLMFLFKNPNDSLKFGKLFTMCVCVCVRERERSSLAGQTELGFGCSFIYLFFSIYLFILKTFC